MNFRILLISKENALLRLLKKVLTKNQFNVETLSPETEAVQLKDKYEFDLAVTISGFTNEDNRSFDCGLQCSCFQAIFLSKYESANGFINAPKAVIYNWQMDREIHFKEFLGDTLGLLKSVPCKSHQLVRVKSRDAIGKIIGAGSAMAKLKQEIGKASRFGGKPVLLFGETGTGKELAAHAIHGLSERSCYSLKTLNCSAIPAELFESLMFGHVAGAFTGASATQKGLVEEAHLGTLFLDEVCQLDLAHQAKLLRFLESGEYMPVGTTRVKHANVRIIAASNQNLEELVKQKKFRDDLYYRLDSIKLTLPPLRERVQDIPALVTHFLNEFALENNCAAPRFTNSLIELLQNYQWPGNVRELKNVIDKIMFGADKEYVDVPDLKPELAEKLLSALPATNISLAEMEKKYILWCLDQNDWKIEQTANVLGIARQTLRKKLYKFNLSPSKE